MQRNRWMQRKCVLPICIYKEKAIYIGKYKQSNCPSSFREKKKIFFLLQNYHERRIISYKGLPKHYSYEDIEKQRITNDCKKNKQLTHGIQHYYYYYYFLNSFYHSKAWRMKWFRLNNPHSSLVSSLSLSFCNYSDYNLQN